MCAYIYIYEHMQSTTAYVLYISISVWSGVESMMLAVFISSDVASSASAKTTKST